ncbi:MAG: hypothetical protein ACE5GG_00405 [Candidatus Omnitrophota bacterium]
MIGRQKTEVGGRGSGVGGITVCFARRDDGRGDKKTITARPRGVAAQHPSFTISLSSILCLLSSIFCLLSSGLCYSQPVPAQELIKNAGQYDGKAVEYEGELIGEPMPRQDGVWFNILDDEGTALGIWVKGDIRPAVDYSGGYKVKGDRFNIRGELHQHCRQHGGDLDIHALSITKTKTGAIAPEILPRYKQRLMVYLGAILGVLWIISIISRTRQRQA